MSDELWAWGDDASAPRVLHAMIRVADLDRSLRFYRDLLGMKVLSRHDVPQGKFSIVFLSLSGNYNECGAIELTYNWEAPVNQDGYSHGTGYGHIAIGVPNVPAMCALLDAGGVEVTVQPKVLFAGGPSLAFVKDPDGYNIELIQTSKLYPGIAAS